MQVAPQPPALLLAGRHELLARALQPVRELHHVRGHGHLASEVLEQAQLVGRDGSADRVRGDAQRPDPFAAMAELERDRRRRRPAPGAGAGVGGELDRDVGEREGLRDRGRDVAERGARVGGLGSVGVAPERGHHLVGVVPAAAEHAIDGPLQATAERVEPDREQRCREHRDRGRRHPVSNRRTTPAP